MALASPAPTDAARPAPFSVRTRSSMQIALSLLATVLATLVCLWLDEHMSVAGLALVYLVAVAATATLLNRTAGIAASLMCVVALNFFFVPPRYSLQVDGAEYWWTLAVLLGASFGLNALIANLRAREALAEAGAARAAQLHQLSETLAACNGYEAMAVHAAQWLSAQLRQPCAIFVRGHEDARLVCHSGHPAEFHPQSAQWAVEHGRPLGRGCVDWPDLPLWCAPFASRDATGAMQLLLGRNARPTPDVLDHWQALARQVGLSVERERAASAARQALAQVEAEATRNTLLASLSHDLRTPLAGIVGSASALRTQGDSMWASERERLLANLENEARDMTLMADNILMLARLTQPQWQLAAQWESLEELLGAAVERLRRRWPGARITWRVPPGLPPVRAEAGLMAQVIANLVDNALRHGGAESEVVIQAGRSREGVFVAVRDHGAGISDEQIGRLFERFEHGRSHSAGHGLGLSICGAIVRAHGGEIQAKRCLPGTEFRIDLPVTQPEEML